MRRIVYSRWANGFCRGLLLAVAVVLCSSSIARAQADIVSAWLERNCDVIYDDCGEAALAAAGSAAQPALIQAAENGPDATLLGNLTLMVGRLFDESQAWILTNGGELGLDATDIQAAQSVTRDQYVADGLSRIILAYRARAIAGLGIVGDEIGKQVLRSFASDSTSPLQSVAQAALRAAEGRVDSTPPTVVADADGALGSNEWYTSDVVVTWEVADPESGITSSAGCEPTTLTADTSGVTLTCTATNGVGLSSAATITIKIQRALSAAIVSDDAVMVNGDPEINGEAGSIHTNLNLTISGNPRIAKHATASGTYWSPGSPLIGGDFGGGRPNITILPVNAADHKTGADYVLTVGGATGGRIHGPFNSDGSLGPVILNCLAQSSRCKTLYGWEYDRGTSGWKVASTKLTNGTYYVHGGVIISGNPGAVGSPKSVTVIAEGSIEVSGNPRFEPHTPELMFVTDRDLKLTGNMQMTAGTEGSILVGEQMQISGNPVLYGRIAIDNAANVSRVVITTEISGDPQITYEGNAGATGARATGSSGVK